MYKKNGYDIVQCLNCRFIFVKSLPSNEQLSRYYIKFDYKNIDLMEPVIRRDAVRSLKLIRKYSNIFNFDKRLLDIGCGRGYFMDESRKIGLDTYGVDYSKKMVNFSKKVLRLNVQHSDIFNFNPKHKFDIITLNQVIEHVTNPRDLIRKCYKLLRSGGIIYIATPNIDSLSAKVLNEDFDHLIPPEHLGYFNCKTLINLLKSANFNILHTGSWSYSQDLAGIIKRLLIKKNGKNKIKLNNALTQLDSSITSRIKSIKYILFDKLFCSIFYRILNIDHLGIMLEVVSIKN